MRTSGEHRPKRQAEDGAAFLGPGGQTAAQTAATGQAVIALTASAIRHNAVLRSTHNFP